MIEILLAGATIFLLLGWAMATRIVGVKWLVAVILPAYWAGFLITQRVSAWNLFLLGLLTWWVPLLPWATLRLSSTSEESARALRAALLASRWGSSGRITLWKLLYWWPMVRMDLGPLGRARVTFSEDKYGLSGCFTLRSRAFARAPWFYGERNPLWPAWMQLMRRYRETPDGPKWRYWGGSRGRAFLGDPELRRACEGLLDTAILSWRGHVAIDFDCVRRHGLRPEVSAAVAAHTLDALEHVSRRWAELSSGTSG
jgi:hypothetical protein